MRIAVLADIHANRHALWAVLDDAEQRGVEAIWFLGDLVGYGPEPVACWEALAQEQKVVKHAWLAGNHDWGLIGRLESRVFQSELGAGQVIGDFAAHAWPILISQREILAHHAALIQVLTALPVLSSPLKHVYLTHGVFYHQPQSGRWDMVGTYSHYVESAATSLQWLSANQKLLETATKEELPRIQVAGWEAPRLMLVGHTHIARVWQAPHPAQWRQAQAWTNCTAAVEAGPVKFTGLAERPLFANPGSVGFARDRAGLATYLLVDWAGDSAQLELRRLSYPVDETVRLMRSLNFPESVVRQLKP